MDAYGWMGRYHAAVTLVSCVTFVWAQSVYHPGSESTLVVLDWGKAMFILTFVAFLSDRTQRAEFETRMRLKEFRRQLDVVVAHLAGGGGGGGVVGTGAAATAAVAPCGSNKSGGDDGGPNSVNGSSSSASTCTSSTSSSSSSSSRCSDSTGRLWRWLGHHGGLVGDGDDDDFGTSLETAVQVSLRRAQETNRLLQASEARQAFFLAAMSHELRSPLTTVLGCTDLLVGVWDLSEEARE